MRDAHVPGARVPEAPVRGARVPDAQVPGARVELRTKEGMRSGRPACPAQCQLRHRQRRPHRQRPLPPGSVHFESGANDRALGIAMRVAVTQQPGPEGRVDKLLQPAPDAVAGHMLEIPQLPARPKPTNAGAAAPCRGRSPSTAPASTPQRQKVPRRRTPPPSHRSGQPERARQRPRRGPGRPAGARARWRPPVRRTPGRTRSSSRHPRRLPAPTRQAGQILPAKRPYRLGFVGGDDGPDPGEERVVDR